MVESWDGTLSSTEFYSAASAFSEQWRKFNPSLPQWSWVPSSKRPWTSHEIKVGYLSMENVILPALPDEDHRGGEQMENEECSSECEDEVLDTAVAVHNDDPGLYHYDFHAVYSASYRVPVLYFQAYSNDGKPLLLGDIEKDIAVDSAKLLSRSKWTFITQEEHPELNRPWYTLHPCGTSEWMKLLFSIDASVAQHGIPIEKYMVSWFSVIGQVFGLKIPFEMLNIAHAQ